MKRSKGHVGHGRRALRRGCSWLYHHLEKANGWISVIVLVVSLVVGFLQIYGLFRRNNSIRRPQHVIAMNTLLQASPTYSICHGEVPIFPEVSTLCTSSQKRRVLSRVIHESNHNNESYEFNGVSVVMPFHDNGMMTCQSVQEIAFQSADTELEFVLVDDASRSVELQKVVRCIEILKRNFSFRAIILHNDVSKGYGDSCNLGAVHANGSLLLFANNDMFMGTGSLYALAKTLSEYPNAGIVGPLFLGHDSIQEYGGVIYNDASAANALRGKGSIPKRILMAQEVDYISAACLLMDKKFFNYLGGFSPEYGRGYYEDTDLAMMVRKAGRKVILQPFAAVFHQEGGTFGSDSAEKLRLMEMNQKIFRAKWSKELQELTAPDTSLTHVREKYMTKPLLWIDQTFITPSHDSGSQRAWQIIKYFQGQGFQIDFLSMSSYAAEEILPSIGVMRFSGIRILTNKTRTLCENRMNLCPYKLIVVSRPQTMAETEGIIQKCCGGVPVVYDTVDLHFLRETRQVLQDVAIGYNITSILKLLQCGKYESRREVQACLDQIAALNTSEITPNQTAHLHSLMQQEISSINTATRSLMLSTGERDIVISLGVPSEKLHVVSNVYPDADIENAIKSLVALQDIESSNDGKNGAIFVGNFQHVPNISALRQLLRITDRIKGQFPEFTMHIAGGHPTYIPENLLEQLKNNKNIKFHGWVSDKDLKTIYDDCIVSFVPLLSGAGVKGKVAAAYLHGIPVIASEIAVEGMGLSHESYILAREPKDYADAYISILSNTTYRIELAKRGLKVLQERFSMTTAAKSLSRILEEVGS